MKEKRRLLDLVAEITSTEVQEYCISVARGINVLLDPNFTERALHDAGMDYAKPEPMSHPMALDSEGRHRPKQPEH